MDTATQTLKNQLRQLRDLHQSGALPLAHYQESKAALERRLVDLIVDGSPDAQSAPPTRKPSAKLLGILLLAVLAIAIAGYSTTRPSLPTQDSSTPDNNAEAPHTTDSAQMERMTEQLAARMAEQPGDANGWAMLARSYSVLGKHPEALKAYEKAVALRKDDAALLADYADSLAVQNQRSLAGKPMQMVEAALKIDPKHMKALALAGTHAFDRKDYARAAQYWERAVQSGPAGHPMVQSLTAALTEARNLAGLPATDPTPVAATATVSGTVILSPALAHKAQPDDTVFIFARAAKGARMPLAILRKQVRDLPFAFTLDDSAAMSPANALSSSTKVIVGARISKSGNAMPQPGDLAGQTGVVAVGASGLRVEISDAIKP
ncbi:MAG: c-type cytochrome biogenesis protein CcmI [Burkholderiales bacterium PBB3]|nr:MAG: c-type cytochrome biogenesis protein CcmI [Burkholderiales bacterium PBB3]